MSAYPVLPTAEGAKQALSGSVGLPDAIPPGVETPLLPNGNARLLIDGVCVGVYASQARALEGACLIARIASLGHGMA